MAGSAALVPSGVMREEDIVFNLVWTGGVYRYLRYFVFTLLDQTACRFRFIANNCTPESVREMSAFAAAVPDRVVETIVLPFERMVPHGTALDHVIERRDDGPVFALIDVDIKATQPFVADFLDLLGPHSALTSGVEVWTDVNTLAVGEVGVGGRHFYAADGFVFGSPHLAIYRRDALIDTMTRWDVGMHTGGRGEMSDAAWTRLEAMGQAYTAYDTLKVVNILLQADGHSLVHHEHDALVHIGGLSHYLAPPQFDFAADHTDGEFDGEPLWASFGGVELRAAVARYTARVLEDAVAGRPPPPVPSDAAASTRERLIRVRDEVTSMVAGAGEWLEYDHG